MRKILKKAGIIFLCVTLAAIVITIALFWNELRSLRSIKQVDDYGMFQMTYYGDYGFEDFLQIGASSDGDIEAFVTKRLLKGLPVNLNITGGGCTVFTVRNERGEVIYGRNFDFSYAPSMQVITRPKNGYASVSTVNLEFAGYSRDNLPSGLNFNSFLSLAAPFLPFDGINEKGLAIALLAVPEASPAFDENKVALNTTTAIRLVLDKAATVNEAVELLKQYNIYFSGGIDCHFLIADASGESILVEYYNNGLQAVTTVEDYQIASNFIAYKDLNIGEGFDEFERYDAVKDAIDNNGGYLNEEQAITVLAEVGVMNNGVDKLQWSVVYNLSTLSGVMFAHRNTDNLIDFQLNS
ncbi:MAG: linear amide C-N hydrolase [Oscillospiraceae bacterium]|nr:linear amide C-N hydrolase [Oscillospiraceae bacterium]